MAEYIEIEIQMPKKRETSYAYKLSEYSLLGIWESERNGDKYEVNPEGRSRKFKVDAEMEKVLILWLQELSLGRGDVCSDRKEEGLLR